MNIIIKPHTLAHLAYCQLHNFRDNSFAKPSKDSSTQTPPGKVYMGFPNFTSNSDILLVTNDLDVVPVKRDSSTQSTDCVFLPYQSLCHYIDWSEFHDTHMSFRFSVYNDVKMDLFEQLFTRAEEIPYANVTGWFNEAVNDLYNHCKIPFVRQTIIRMSYLSNPTQFLTCLGQLSSYFEYTSHYNYSIVIRSFEQAALAGARRYGVVIIMGRHTPLFMELIDLFPVAYVMSRLAIPWNSHLADCFELLKLGSGKPRMYHIYIFLLQQPNHLDISGSYVEIFVQAKYLYDSYEY